jgi:hypothetical protein
MRVSPFLLLRLPQRLLRADSITFPKKILFWYYRIVAYRRRVKKRIITDKPLNEKASAWARPDRRLHRGLLTGAVSPAIGDNKPAFIHSM